MQGIPDDICAAFARMLVIVVVVGSADPTASVLQQIIQMLFFVNVLLDFLPWTNPTIG